MKRPSRVQWYEQIRQQAHMAYLIHHLSKFKLPEQIFIGLLVLLALMFMFCSLVKFQPLSGGDTQYFGLFSGYFWRTALVVSIILIKMIVYNTSFWLKDIVHTLLWTKNQDYIYNLVWLSYLLVSLLSIQDMVWLTQVSGASFSLTSYVVIMEFVLIGAMVYTIVQAYLMLTHTRKKHLQPTMHYQSDESTQRQPTQTLFE